MTRDQPLVELDRERFDPEDDAAVKWFDTTVVRRLEVALALRAAL